MRQASRFILLGVSFGVALAIAATRGTSSLLFGLQPDDPLTLVAAALFLIGVALGASFVPAWRASRLDPMIALRCE